LMPHCCIGVDVIVGFPGESHEDFLDTYNYLNGLDISYLHVFTYSERPNTTANKMAEKVPLHERAERSKMLHILSDKKRRRFYEQYIGATRPVLWEIENDGNTMHGFTDNYIKVKKQYDPVSVNDIESVTLTEIDAEMIVSTKIPTLVY
jgi:threonylcarbamoyladenosine tRNA methylthiotransferase MtaB